VAKDTSKPLPTPFAGALESDPHENARRAEETLDSPRRREQEEAMRDKERATGEDERMVRDTAVDRPPD
jgi:hypothetical protein